MNMSPMPMAASRSRASNATIMAMPRWDFICFVDFPFMFVTSVVYQTCHSSHGHLNVFMRVRILYNSLRRNRDLDTLDSGQCRCIRDRSRQINGRPGIVKCGKNRLVSYRDHVLHLNECGARYLG